MLSSLSATLGWASRGNYAAGGSYQEAFVCWRCSIGLPAISLDLGMAKGVGYVSESRSALDRLHNGGQSLPLTEQDVTRALAAGILDPFAHPQILLSFNSGPGPQWDLPNKSAMGRDAPQVPLKRQHQWFQRGDIWRGGCSRYHQATLCTM